MGRTERTTEIQLISALTLTALVLRWIGLDSQAIALDEPFTIFYAQQGFSEIIAGLAPYNNPPLFELILHPWIALGGTDAAWVRIVPMCFGALLPGAVYLLARQFTERVVALTSGLLIALSTFHIYFSHEARAYSLFALLTALATLFLFRAISVSGWRRWACYGISCVMLIYSHYFGFVVIATHVLVVVLLYREAFVPILVTMVVIGLAYVPQVSVMIGAFTNSASEHWVEQPGLDALYENLRKFFNAPVVAVVFIAILMAGMVQLFRKQGWSRKAKALLIMFVVPYLGLFLISQKMPVFLDRYLIFLTIPLFIVVSVSAGSLPLQGALRWIPAGVLVLMMAVTMDIAPDNGREPDMVAEHVHLIHEQDDQVVVVPGWSDLVFLYHYDRSAFEDTENKAARMDEIGVSSYWPGNGLDGSGRLIVVGYGKDQLEDEDLLQQLSAFKLLHEQKFKGAVVMVYER